MAQHNGSFQSILGLHASQFGFLNQFILSYGPIMCALSLFRPRQHSQVISSNVHSISRDESSSGTLIKDALPMKEGRIGMKNSRS